MHELPLNVYKFHYDLKFAFWNFHTILTATNSMNPQADHTM